MRKKDVILHIYVNENTMYYLFQNICIYKHVDIHSHYNTSASFILRSVEEDCFKHTISNESTTDEETVCRV